MTTYALTAAAIGQLGRMVVADLLDSRRRSGRPLRGRP